MSQVLNLTPQVSRMDACTNCGRPAVESGQLPRDKWGRVRQQTRLCELCASGIDPNDPRLKNPAMADLYR